MMRWIKKRATAWHRSDIADLPTVRPETTRALQNWLVLAGGLALVLSRATRDELDNRFRCSRYLYEQLRARLREGKSTPNIGPDLVGETMHEITGVADPMTLAAGRACFAVCIAAERRRSAAGQIDAAVRGPQPDRGSQVSQQQSTGLPAAREEAASTQVNLDLLMERSSKLRSALAFARTTTFGSP